MSTAQSLRTSHIGPARWPSYIGQTVETPHYPGAPGMLRHEDGRFLVEWRPTSSGVREVMYLFDQDTISLSDVVTTRAPQVAPKPRLLATSGEPKFLEFTYNVRRR